MPSSTDNGVEARHEAAHCVFAYRMGIKIHGIDMTPNKVHNYSACLATEKRRDWILAAPAEAQGRRAEDVIRMLFAGNVMDMVMGSIDLMASNRSQRDFDDNKPILEEFIPEPEQRETQHRLRREAHALISDTNSPIRKAIDAIAAKLIATGTDGLNFEEIREIVTPIFESAEKKRSDSEGKLSQNPNSLDASSLLALSE